MSRAAKGICVVEEGIAAELRLTRKLERQNLALIGGAVA